MKKEIIYYTDNTLNDSLNTIVREQLLKSGTPIISVSLFPIDFGRNIVVEGKRGYFSMFNQILTGLESSDADFIFLCEHDILYHPSHFEFTPERNDVYYYNSNFWKYKLSTGQVVGYEAKLLSQLCANREILVTHFRNKIKTLKEGVSSVSTKIKDHPTLLWKSEYANIDIRHGGNLTGVKRFHPSEFRNKNNCKEWRETTIFELDGWNSEHLMNMQCE